MGDRMTPIPFGNLMTWALTEEKTKKTVFGTRKRFHADPAKYLSIFGEKIETPFGPAAGPNTQLAQNIIASYLTGSRFFELKTVQILDGEDLPVNKPCILAEDECYNCEWSTELYVPQAYAEYVKAWVALKALSVEWGLGAADGFVFNISVGYDLAGIKSEKIDTYLNDMIEAKDHPVFKECIDWLRSHLNSFEHLTEADIDAIPSDICKSATVSTLHGCPPEEIESIASYLIEEKGLNTFVKCNPTLLGYDEAREIMDSMGYDYVVFGDFHFRDDLQFKDAVPMLKRLKNLAESRGLEFGVKITNTFPVDVTKKELPSEEMYMSGKSLCALSLSVALKLSRVFEGKLRISYSGGADAFNIERIYGLGIWPITAATTLLKPGGYNRGVQIAEELSAMEYRPFTGVDVTGLDKLVDQIKKDPHHIKPAKPLPGRKIEKKVPLLDCFFAPCMEGCPIHQDIPAYVKLTAEGKTREALRVILEKNPLPFMTGTLCNHRCMEKCTRNFYEEAVAIRAAKLKAAQGGYDAVMQDILAADKNTAERKLPGTGKKTAIVGAGPAGIASASFLAREGVDVTVFDKRKEAGGTVRHMIPSFRIDNEAIRKDVELSKACGAKYVTDTEITDLQKLKDQGYETIILAVGSHKGIPLGIETEKEYNAVSFLEAAKKDPEALDLGRHVAVIGAGNTAMDAARMAKRISGVTDVSIVYRRTKRYMPADEEELIEAVQDGVVMRELLAPKKQQGGVLTCSMMVLGDPDESGRQRPVETGETVEIPADTVIASLGERVDSSLYEGFGVALNEKGTPILDPDTMETSVPGVYAIGDGAVKPASIVMAIRDARMAVNHILGLEEKENLVYDTDVDKAAAKKGILVHSGQAANEAERCLECNHICENCVDVCPNRANAAIQVPGRIMPAIVHVDYMCNECGNCRSFCPYSSAPYRDKFTLFANEADFDSSENDGYTILDRTAMKVKVRLAGEVSTQVLTDPGCSFYDGLKQVMLTIERDYLYLTEMH
ncbi:MAG: putative selenate reductase subunit YgfK [Clostridiales bacterium]|nr:putative selenate reductase subunit YgfK [Clostridiales bacterium]